MLGFGFNAAPKSVFSDGGQGYTRRPSPAIHVNSKATLLYDGQCPLCSAYGRYVAAHRTGPIELLDARNQTEMARELCDKGFDINRGMILLTPDGTFQGRRAIQAISPIISYRGPPGAVLQLFARIPGLATIMYPAIKWLRLISLRLLRRDPVIHF